MKKSPFYTAFALALSAAGMCTAAQAETRVDSVFADRLNGKLFIDGHDFKNSLLNLNAGGQKPYVEIDGQALTVNGAASTDSHIEATLPAKADGEYQIFISRTCVVLSLCGLPPPHLLSVDQQTNYSLSLGATGAQGAKGAQGATGAQGANGTAGTQGATGAQGANGTAGTQGAQGAGGAQGANGT